MSADRSSTVDAPKLYTWMRGFNYAPGWEKLTAEIDGQLKPLGYKPYKEGWIGEPGPDGLPAEVWARGWQSADGKYLVTLQNIGHAKGNTSVHLEYSSADYVLVVNQLKGVPAN